MHNIHAYVHIYVPPAELKESHNHRCLQQPKHATTIPCTSLLKASCFQVLGWSQRSHKQDTKVLKKAEGRKTEQITTDSLKKNSQEISQVIAQFLLFDTIWKIEVVIWKLPSSYEKAKDTSREDTRVLLWKGTGKIL